MRVISAVPKLKALQDKLKKAVENEDLDMMQKLTEAIDKIRNPSKGVSPKTIKEIIEHFSFISTYNVITHQKEFNDRWELDFNNSFHFIVFKSDEDGRAFTIDRVKQQMMDDPWGFDDFLDSYSDSDDLDEDGDPTYANVDYDLAASEYVGDWWLDFNDHFITSDGYHVVYD